MNAALQIASIILSIALIAIVLLQVKGSGLGNLLGGDGGMGGISRTRRGLEKTLFQITIVLSFVFVAVSILAVAFTR
ncbi:MAG: preprotein translocase subunit SecG [Chloroflexota bacterium]|jgi:preprotein translocase subunit SecG|nr:preprotein translocase subunit SecG [Chloroflexota bacterium]